MARVTSRMILDRFEKEIIRSRYYEAYKITKHTLSPRLSYNWIICSTCGRRIHKGETFYIVWSRLRGTAWTSQRRWPICHECRTGKSKWWNAGDQE